MSVALPFVAFAVAEHLITPIAVARGLSLRIALALRLVGTAVLVTFALLPPLTWWGPGLAMVVVVSEWKADPSLLRWVWHRSRGALSRPSR